MAKEDSLSKDRTVRRTEQRMSAPHPSLLKCHTIFLYWLHLLWYNRYDLY